MFSQQQSKRLLDRFLSIGLVLWCLSICSTTQITAAETVKIQATDSTATEGTTADVGLFTVSRATAIATPLTVYLTPSGTATAGIDYGAIPSSVVIPASATSVTIYIHAIDDTIAESSETIKVTIATNAAYTKCSV